MLDWKTYISGRGSVLEIIKAGVEIPPGSILFEDPPTHDIHRGLLSRVFTPQEDAGARAPGARLLRRGARPARRDRRVRFRRGPGQVHAHAGDRHAARHPRGGPGGHPRADRRRPAPRRGRPERDRVRRARLRRGLLRLHHLARRAPVRRPHDRVAQRRVRGRARHDAHPDPRRDPRVRRPAVRGRERDDDAPDRLRRRGPGPPPGPARRAGGGPLARQQRHRGVVALRGALTRPVPLRDDATSRSTARRCPRAASWSC